MTDDLLPTPRAQDSYERRNYKTIKAIMEAGGDVTLPTFLKYHTREGSMTDQPTSPSSQGSEGSTSPSKPSGSDASDRSSGTSPAPLFSSDTGPESPDGVTLLPTPDGALFNDGQTAENWSARKQREIEKGYNGNGGGTPLAAAIPLIAQGIDPQMLPTPTAGDAKSAGNRSLEDDRVKSGKHRTSSSGGSPVSPSATPAGDKGRTMSDTSGLSSPGSSVRLDPPWSSSRTFPACSLSDGMWVTDQQSLFGSTPSARFSGTWPRWGSMRGGVVYEHPTPERLTDENGSSSSLNVPTPTASDAHWNDSDSERSGIKGNHNLSLVSWSRALLPTINARDYKGPRTKPRTPGDLLPDAIDDLLPTPNAWLGRRPENSTADPERAASRANPGITGKRSIELPDALASLGEPTNPPSEGGS